SVSDARRGAAAHRRVHHPLQRRVAHRAARPSDAGGRSRRGPGGVAMITLRTRSLSGARINDRRGGHALTSPARVQETGCGTNPGNALVLKEVETAAQALGLRWQGFAVQRPDKLVEAFE